MKLHFLIVVLVNAGFYQINYEECEQVIGYWSKWGDWSDCKCKTNYEVTRFGKRYVKERKRQCFCGADGVTNGCDTWCGRPHQFGDEEYCEEEVTFDWAQWSTCVNSRRTRKKENCIGKGCVSEVFCEETQTQPCTAGKLTMFLTFPSILTLLLTISATKTWSAAFKEMIFHRSCNNVQPLKEAGTMDLAACKSACESDGKCVAIEHHLNDACLLWYTKCPVQLYPAATIYKLE